MERPCPDSQPVAGRGQIGVQPGRTIHEVRHTLGRNNWREKYSREHSVVVGGAERVHQREERKENQRGIRAVKKGMLPSVPRGPRGYVNLDVVAISHNFGHHGRTPH